MIQKEGSVSKAAQKLFISQSALSQQLLKLEAEIGAPIFERGITPLRPTHLGEEYLVYVKKILFEYEQANRVLESMQENKKGKLIVGIPVNRSTQFLPIFLPDFMRRYPGIELVFVEDHSWRLDEKLLNGEIDLSLLTTYADNPNITFRPLIREEIYVACQKDCPLDQKSTQRGYLDFRDCADETFIHMKKGFRLYREAIRLFEQYDIQPRTILNTGNVDLARRLAAQGAGICLASQLPKVLNPLFPRPSYHRIGEDGVFWTLGVSYHKEKYISWAMKLFIQCILDELAYHFPDEVIR